MGGLTALMGAPCTLTARGQILHKKRGGKSKHVRALDHGRFAGVSETSPALHRQCENFPAHCLNAGAGAAIPCGAMALCAVQELGVEPFAPGPGSRSGQGPQGRAFFPKEQFRHEISPRRAGRRLPLFPGGAVLPRVSLHTTGGNASHLYWNRAACRGCARSPSSRSKGRGRAFRQPPGSDPRHKNRNDTASVPYASKPIALAGPAEVFTPSVKRWEASAKEDQNPAGTEDPVLPSLAGLLPFFHPFTQHSSAGLLPGVSPGRPLSRNR